MLLSNGQLGFWKGRSAEDHLLTYGDVALQVDGGNVVYMDYITIILRLLM